MSKKILDLEVTAVSFETIINSSTPELRTILDSVRAQRTKKTDVDIYWLLGFIQGVLTERQKDKYISGPVEIRMPFYGPQKRSDKCYNCKASIPEVNEE